MAIDLETKKITKLRKSIKNLKIEIVASYIASVQLYTISGIYIKEAIEANEFPQLIETSEPIISFAAGILLIGATIGTMNMTNKKETLKAIIRN